LCVGAAARQLRHEDPACVVTVFAPLDYAEVYRHLYGVENFIGLGTVKEIKAQGRRERGGPIDSTRYPYLAPLRGCEPKTIVDLWCPGEAYELACTLPAVDRGRAGLFCAAAKTKGLSHACPSWGFRFGEDSGPVSTHLGCSRGREPWVAVALRASALERTYPRPYAEYLVQGLLARGLRPLVLDLVEPHFIVPDGAVPVIGLALPALAWVLANCWGAICVDSAILHLAAATRTRCIGLFGPTSVATIHTYPLCTALEGMDVVCEGPCSRRPAWGYTVKCTERGCARLMNLNPCTILAEVDRLWGEPPKS